MDLKSEEGVERGGEEGELKMNNKHVGRNFCVSMIEGPITAELIVAVEGR